MGLKAVASSGQSLTPSFTSVTTPLVIGGTAVGSTLTLQSTTANGTTDKVLVKVGNNGGTTAGTFDHNGFNGIIGGTTPAAGAFTSITTSGVSGVAATFAGGTATTDVAAISVTRTNNNAAVATGVQFAFTDTASASGFLPFQIFGGAAGTTSLLKVSKAGLLGVPTAGGVDFQDGNGNIKLVGAGTTELDVIVGGSTSFSFQSSNNSFLAGSNKVIGFSSSTNPASASQDTAISRVSAGVMGVGTGAVGSVAGTISAAAFISGGTAGVDFGPGVVTSITVKKGIITAIS